jgi:hypothetical protein
VHDRLRERGELHTLAAKRNDLLDNLFHRPIAAVQHRTDLNRCGPDDCHLAIPFVLKWCSLLRFPMELSRLAAILKRPFPIPLQANCRCSRHPSGMPHLVHCQLVDSGLMNSVLVISSLIKRVRWAMAKGVSRRRPRTALAGAPGVLSTGRHSPCGARGVPAVAGAARADPSQVSGDAAAHPEFPRGSIPGSSTGRAAEMPFFRTFSHLQVDSRRLALIRAIRLGDCTCAKRGIEGPPSLGSKRDGSAGGA